MDIITMRGALNIFKSTHLGSSTLSAQCTMGIENLNRPLNEDTINICRLKTTTGFS
jgi:hypothetical protein